MSKLASCEANFIKVVSIKNDLMGSSGLHALESSHKIPFRPEKLKLVHKPGSHTEEAGCSRIPFWSHTAI